MRVSRLAAALLLVGLTAAAAETARLRAAPPHVALDAVPLRFAGWRGHDAAALDPDTVRILAADSYLNRSYDGPQTSVGLYVAYYARQRPGVSIHSPLHCLPGTGWEPLDVTARRVPRGDGSYGDVRRMVVRKGRDRAVVLYWYAVHGRMIGNELLSKAWLLHDAIRFNRGDAALVRVVVPVVSSVDTAETEGLSFVHALLPHISSLWTT